MLNRAVVVFLILALLEVNPKCVTLKHSLVGQAQSRRAGSLRKVGRILRAEKKKKIRHGTHPQTSIRCVWRSRWRSAALRLTSRRCWRSSPRNCGGPGTPAAPSRQLPIRTGTSRQWPGTACRSRGSAGGRFRATSPARRKVPIGKC